MKKIILLFLLILNINIVANSSPIKNHKVLYLIQETKKEVINNIKTSNLQNKTYLINQLNEVEVLEKNLGEGHPSGMEIRGGTNQYTENGVVVKEERIWVDKKILLNPKYYNLSDEQLVHNIKYQYTIFLTYFYLDNFPKTSGDIKKDKDFQYIAKITNFNSKYTPKIKNFKGEAPIEDARILSLVEKIKKDVKNKINHSNISNKKKILSELENIKVYSSLNNQRNFVQIKMGKVSYGSDSSSQINWVDKRFVFKPEASYLQSYILKPAITLKFAEFIYNFQYPSSKNFDENKYNKICDLLEVNSNKPYDLPDYPNETLVEDKRVLYNFALMHKEVLDTVKNSNLKDKERLVKELENIPPYRTKKPGKEVAAMIFTKGTYRASSIDGKKVFNTTFIDNKRILFREKAFKLNNEALQNTIKHEFAHALVSLYYSYDPKDDHGKEFKYMCKVLGVDPRYSQAVVPMTEDDMLK